MILTFVGVFGTLIWSLLPKDIKREIALKTLEKDQEKIQELEKIATTLNVPEINKKRQTIDDVITGTIILNKKEQNEN